MSAMQLLLTALLPTVASYYAAWNVQWPELCPEKVPSDALSKFGISANEQNKFNGRAVTTLYNHPGSFTIGNWPCTGSDGKEHNGGLPQLGNLSLHLAQVSRDVQANFPDPDHDGLIVIDWEEWEPYLQFWGDPKPAARWNFYMNKSYELAGGSKDLAIAQWNKTALAFMAETLKTVVALRPKAKVGYYGMINCGSTPDIGKRTCPDVIKARHDALAPLWAAGTALFPSIYSYCRYTNATSTSPSRCIDESHEEIKIPITLEEVDRVNKLRMPVVPFTWYDLYQQSCAKSPPAGTGHCPLMLNTTDLHNEFALAKSAPNVEGIIIWGAHGDVRPGTNDCKAFGEYVETTLGPLLQSLVQ